MGQRASIRQRKGSAYVLIIGVSMLAAAITIAATLAGRSQSRALDGSNNASEARAYAQAAVDIGRLSIAQDSNWRTNRSNGSWLSNVSIGSGKMSLDALNPNGAMNRFNADPILLTGTGTCGTSVQKLCVAITPQIKPYTCLATAMTSGGNVTFATANVTPSGVTISSNGNIPGAGGASVWCNVEAAGTIGGGGYLGTITSGATPRTLPGSTVFDYYTANGTTISLTSLPIWNGTRALYGGVLAPTANTIGGGTNSDGIYVIDCQGALFTIGNVRIVGTVVLLNCGGLTIKNSTRWSPAVSTFPSLLVQGNVSINLDSTPLSETVQSTNYNPTGAPYPWPTGTTNTLLTDTYPSDLRGLMYATGNVKFQSDASLGQVVCGGTVTYTNTAISFNYTSDYVNNPPPGFYDVDMTASSMTWTQLTN